MDRASRWLAERPYRATVINVVMLSTLLAMTDSVSLYMVVGGGTALVAAACFLLRAAGLTAGGGTSGNAYGLALIWIPGTLAIALAVVALHLIATEPPSSLGRTLGMFLFAVEAAMLTMAAADLAPGTASHAGREGAA